MYKTPIQSLSSVRLFPTPWTANVHVQDTVMYKTPQNSQMLGVKKYIRRDGMGREEGSGWGTHVYLWRIHFDIWQNLYNIVKFKNKIKLKKNTFITNTFYFLN